MSALVAAVGGVLLGGAVVSVVRNRPVHSTAAGWPVGRWWRTRVTHPKAHDDDTSLGDLVAVLDAVGRAMRSGLGVHAAVRSAAPSGGVHRHDLETVVGDVDCGVPLATALRQWRTRSSTPGVGLAAAVLAFGLHTGASLPRAVDGAAATLRERLALLGEVRVQSSQARASAVVVVGAPVAFTAVVAVADARVPAFLFATPGGWLCVAVGVGLEVGCVRWMRVLMARAGTT